MIDDKDWSEETYTYEELEQKVKEEYENMFDEEKHMRAVHNDPTFKQQVLTSMKPNQIVILNEYDYSYEYKNN